jgi:hypothetical protein
VPSWRSLRPSQGQQESTRFPVDDLMAYLNTMTYGGGAYPLSTPGAIMTMAGDVEPAMQSFIDYAQRAYGANAVVFACMALRQLVFSSVRFQWQEINTGRPSRLFGSSALTPLERPWQGGTTQDLASRMIQDADLCGNWYGIRDTPLTRIGGDISTFEIARLRPDWVDIIRTDRIIRGQKVGYRTAGIAYWEGGRNSGQEAVIFFPGEYAHFAPHPDPLANWRGMSWLTPVARELQADVQMSKHKIKYFENGATPNLIVRYPQGAREEDMKKVKALFTQKYEGVDNAYKTLHLGGGADITVVGNNMEQVNFKQVQGAGEVRIAAAAGTPPAILGLSDALSGSSLNAGNFSAARRRFADGTMHPMWQQAAGSLQVLFDGSAALDNPGSTGGASLNQRIKGGGVRLWYDARDIPFLREDAQDEAQIRATKASSVRQLIDAGFEPESAVAAIDTGDLTQLKHTGLFSVQLQPPGSGGVNPDANTQGAGTVDPSVAPPKVAPGQAPPAAGTKPPPAPAPAKKTVPAQKKAPPTKG